jgi:hypothetical protein
MEWLPIAICAGAPLAAAGLAVYLRRLHGDRLFGLEYPPHRLNDPDDPRVTRLGLDQPREQHKDQRPGGRKAP